MNQEIQEKMLELHGWANFCHEHVMKIEKTRNEIEILKRISRLHREVDASFYENNLEKLTADQDFIETRREVQRLSEEIKDLAIEEYQKVQDFSQFRELKKEISMMTRYEDILVIHEQVFGKIS